MKSVELKKVPDGGWGWVVVGAVALINMTNQSILSVYGLLFGSHLRLMGQETFTAALINNLNSCAMNFSGLFIGPAIKRFKPRNVAATGCIMVSFGLAICAFANESWQFIVGYSFFVGFGLGLISPSTFVAINSYFSSKRGRAVGVSLAGAGVGQIVLPHVVRVLLEVYGFRIAVLGMSLLSLFGLLGALLLKPLQSQIKHNNRKHMRLISESAESNKAPNGMAIKIVVPSKTNIANDDNAEQQVYKQTTSSNTDNDDNASKSSKGSNKFCQRIVEAMDLELLTDPVFLSIIIGMALVYTSTVNFSMLFPHFLEYSVHVSKHNIATCMSIAAGADILCRLLLPCITDKLEVPYRVVFLLGTVGLLVARSALAEAAELPTIIVMSVFIGMAKSATVLNNNLTVSSHCRPEKLPGALGLNMMFKGVLVISIGQLLGWIRDYTNSYVLCLHAQNILLLLVVVVWTPEIYYHYWRKRRQAKHLAENNATAEEVTKMNPC